MITAYIGKTAYRIPTRWADLSLDTYVDLLSRKFITDIELISFFLDLDTEAVTRLSLASWIHILPLLEFIKTDEPKDYFDLDFRVEDMPYGSYLDAVAAIEKAADKPELAIARVYAYYTPLGLYNYERAVEKAERIRKESYISTFAPGRKMINDTIEYANAFARALKKIPETKQEKEAGFDIMNKFGVNNVLDALTDGDDTKREFYLRMPTGQVHQKLLKINHAAYCNHRYQEVINRQHELR